MRKIKGGANNSDHTCTWIDYHEQLERLPGQLI